ncbi:aldo/keto reductase [Streptococcus macacae]|uniref:Organophosphate reductase n=1 Tax=Streptococcus macacae NCTC 11558 TaxID=764298 RepID=G5JZ35_9STRE|nr:aldo/keto reductase [Streptococcus macacae]EHJ52012.1 organophosphate reductase [Streptococcus macacae NCTC 11558]SUN78289.1 aldo/keto reductase family protein [Streptococcus macacae NCTC 11558]
MDYVTLNTGAKMPILGFGVYQIPPEETERAVGDAIALGYRHIDTAQYYRNEAGVGHALKASGLPREEFFITTKVGTSGYRDTKHQIERALRHLQTDYIDLMLVHWVMSDYHGTYQALEEAHREGKLRAIGLSNFNQRQIQGIMAQFATVPAVLQNEMHIFHQQNAMREFTKEKGIQFESWAPFGEGAHDIFNHPVIAQIGTKYGKTVAQVILRFIIQEGVVAIPKSIRKERMAENFAIFDFELSPADMAALRHLNEDRGLFGWNN